MALASREATNLETAENESSEDSKKMLQPRTSPQDHLTSGSGQESFVCHFLVAFIAFKKSFKKRSLS
jgi:hypothetical protein